MMRSALGAAAATCVALFAAPALAASVSTLAGSGVPGFADGAAGAASFMLPVAVAYDAAGNVLVVDAAAQRIRRVRPDGRVDTVAGTGPAVNGGAWVRGGFADGDARTARFNWPRGIAVAKTGVIYVADTGNHCIRAIALNGRVSVYAGSPSRRGRDTGARLQASFGAPMGLSIDANDNLYVADPEAGVRMIAPDGAVTEIPLGRAPVGVAVTGASGRGNLYVADADGILVTYADGAHWRLRSVNRADGSTAAASAPDPKGTLERDIAMEAPAGYPLSLTAVDDGNVFFGDPRTNNIRYLYPGYELSKIVAGSAVADASGEGAGYRDGPAADARFNAPVGTAALPDGTIAVADAGNRRIRLLKLDRRADFVEHGGLVPADTSDKAYRVLYLGPSFTWYDSTGQDSITAYIAAQLAADRVLEPFGLEPSVRFFSGMGRLEPLDSVVHTIADLSVDKVVVLDLTYLIIEPDLHAFVAAPATWQPLLTARLKAARAVLDAAHIRFVVALHPLSNEYSSSETIAARFGIDGMVPVPRAGDLLRQATAAAGVDVIDLYPDFRDEAHHPVKPAAGMVDMHFTPYGRELVGRGVARGLERLAPWAARQL